MSDDMTLQEKDDFLRRQRRDGALVTAKDIEKGVQELLNTIEGNNRRSYNPTRRQMMWYELARDRAPHLLVELHRRWFLPEGGSPTFRPVGYQTGEPAMAVVASIGE